MKLFLKILFRKIFIREKSLNVYDNLEKNFEAISDVLFVILNLINLIITYWIFESLIITFFNYISLAVMYSIITTFNCYENFKNEWINEKLKEMGINNRSFNVNNERGGCFDSK